MADLKRILKFGLVGAAGFVADAGALTLVSGVLGPYWGRALSFVIAVTVTWSLNRSFTFADRPSPHKLHEEFGRYFISMLAGGAVNYCTYAVLVSVLPRGPVWAVLAVGVGSLSGMMVNLGFAQRFVFKPGAK